MHSNTAQRAINTIVHLTKLIFQGPFRARINNLRLVSRYRRATMRIRRKVQINQFSVSHRVLMPLKLQRVQLNLHIYQQRTRKTTVTRLVIQVIRLEDINHGPQRQRATTIATFNTNKAKNTPYKQVLRLVPQGINRFRRTRFLTLVRMNKTKRHRLRRSHNTNTLNTRHTILPMYNTITRRPIRQRSVMFTNQRLKRHMTNNVTSRIVITRRPDNNKAKPFNTFRAFLSNRIRIITSPVLLNRLRIRSLTRVIQKNMRVLTT